MKLARGSFLEWRSGDRRHVLRFRVMCSRRRLRSLNPRMWEKKSNTLCTGVPHCISRRERNKHKRAVNGNTVELTLISANVSWNKNFAEIARMKPDIMALPETMVTKTAKPAANRAAGSARLSVVWGKPCEQLRKKSKERGIAQTPWLGRQGVVAVFAKKDLGILAGGMEGTTSTELYESGRYVSAAVLVRHGNRKLFVHVASLCNESTNQNEVAKKVRNERALQRAFTDAAALGDQSFFLCADLRESVAIDDAVKTGDWIDVGTRYAEEDEVASTQAGFKNCDKHTRGRSVTRPDRILANKIAMEMIKSIEVLRESTLPGHLPLKLTLNTAPLKQRITVVKVPRPFPIEDPEEPEEERSREKAEELVEERKGEIEQALRAGQEDQAWSLASSVAEMYFDWRCNSGGNDKPKGGRGMRPTKDERYLFDSQRRRKIVRQPGNQNHKKNTEGKETRNRNSSKDESKEV